jgi:hypothetical protein
MEFLVYLDCNVKCNYFTYYICPNVLLKLNGFGIKGLGIEHGKIKLEQYHPRLTSIHALRGLRGEIL